MKKFTRHLLRTTALTTALTLSFLLIIDLLIQSAGQLEHLPPRLLILTHLLQLPDRLQQFLPAAVLIGAILGLGQLANQNELTIAQNSGQSPLRIATPALILALFLGALSLLLNQTIAPKWQQKSQQLHHPTAPIAPQTLWFKDQQTLIQINHLNPDGSLGDLRLITHTPSQITLTTAPRATYHPPPLATANPPPP
uniref:LptF/LptG family permease n=1 Tax=Rappaport israeli TaxID=1839807 RepID=UPI000B1E1C77